MSFANPLDIRHARRMNNKKTMNEDNILIIGDDTTGAEPITPTSPAAGKTGTGDGSWLGGRSDALAEGFLHQHATEFQDYERREREKRAAAEQFRALESEIASRHQWLEGLQQDIADYEHLDLAADLYKNMQLTGRPLLDIAQNPLFAAAALIKEHGKTVLRLAEKDVAELQNKFTTFKTEQHQLLKELGLV